MVETLGSILQQIHNRHLLDVLAAVAAAAMVQVAAVGLAQ
jgi:hypothetical protein